MKNDNVIPFPKEQAVRVRVRERHTHQKAVLALSILSVLMLSVLSNQWLTRPTSSTNSRSIASVGSVSSVADVKWEHELARELSRSKGVGAHLAEKPSLRDELVFGELEGRYGVRMKDGRVESIEYSTARDGETPLVLKDRAAFLMKYRSLLSVDYDQAGLVGSADGQETWNLLGDGRTIVGQAKFQLDAEGRVLSVTLSQ